jgi:hypothetical protein
MPIIVDIYAREKWLLPPDYDPGADPDLSRRALHEMRVALRAIVVRAVNANRGSSNTIKQNRVWINILPLSDQAENAGDVQVRVNPGIGRAPYWIRYGLIFLTPMWRNLRRVWITICIKGDLQKLIQDNPELLWPRSSVGVIPAAMSGFTLSATGDQIGQWGGVPKDPDTFSFGFPRGGWLVSGFLYIRGTRVF